VSTALAIDAVGDFDDSSRARRCVRVATFRVTFPNAS
jgi:hypothetical protein